MGAVMGAVAEGGDGLQFSAKRHFWLLAECGAFHPPTALKETAFDPPCHIPRSSATGGFSGCGGGEGFLSV